MGSITRRGLLLAATALAMPRVACPQAARKYHLCILDSTGRLTAPYYVAFDERLRARGFVEGRNLVISERTSEGRIERLPALARELSHETCDVFVAPGNEANLVALERETKDTPIVIIAVDYDPQATGQVLNLARPGGRITGVSAVQTVLPAKRLELLKELLPNVRRIAVLSDSESTGQLEVARAGAENLGVELQVLEFKRAPYDYKSAFDEARRKRAEALLALGSANFVPARPLITQLAATHRLPSIFHHSVWAEAGGLMSYGPNFSDVFSQAAEKVARIFQGAKPADMPIEQPTKFELVINSRTARAIGVTIPPSLLLRADRMIDEAGR
jgi:putative ABC transport system substrate-binding protein